MKNILLFGALVCCLAGTPFVFADETELSDQEIDEYSNELDRIIEKLQQPLPNEEKATLLYQKAELMFALFGPLRLKPATESLLEAIELAPDKEEYKELLAQAYDAFWKDKDLSGADQISKDLSLLKEKCEKVLGDIKK